MTLEYKVISGEPVEVDWDKVTILRETSMSRFILDNKGLAFAVLKGRWREHAIAKSKSEEKIIAMAKQKIDPVAPPQALMEPPTTVASFIEEATEGLQPQVLEAMETPPQETMEQIVDAAQEQPEPVEVTEEVSQEGDPDPESWYLVKLIHTNIEKRFQIGLLENNARVYLPVKVVKSRSGHVLCKPPGTLIQARIKLDKQRRDQPRYIALEAFIDDEFKPGHVVGTVDNWNEAKATFGSVLMSCGCVIFALSPSKYEPLSLVPGDTVEGDLAVSEKTGLGIIVGVTQAQTDEEV